MDLDDYEEEFFPNIQQEHSHHFHAEEIIVNVVEQQEEIAHVPVIQSQETRHDIHVSHAQEEIVHVPEIIQQERIIQQFLEQVVEVPLPMSQEEIVHVPTITAQPRHDIHVPHEQEEIAHVPKIIEQERIIQQTVQQLQRTKEMLEVNFSQLCNEVNAKLDSKVDAMKYKEANGTLGATIQTMQNVVVRLRFDVETNNNKLDKISSTVRHDVAAVQSDLKESTVALHGRLDLIVQDLMTVREDQHTAQHSLRSCVAKMAELEKEAISRHEMLEVRREGPHLQAWATRRRQSPTRAPR